MSCLDLVQILVTLLTSCESNTNVINTHMWVNDIRTSESRFCLSSALCGGSGEHIEQEQSQIPALGYNFT